MKLRYLSALFALMFLLGNYKGYLALWRDGYPEPYQVYPYKAALLPPEDQQLLEEGIHVPGERELQQLLEDYLS